MNVITLYKRWIRTPRLTRARKRITITTTIEWHGACDEYTWAQMIAKDIKRAVELNQRGGSTNCAVTSIQLTSMTDRGKTRSLPLGELRELDSIFHEEVTV